MKSKDVLILKKILEYCSQVTEACEMFGNEYNKFVKCSVFQNACCVFQIIKVNNIVIYIFVEI